MVDQDNKLWLTGFCIADTRTEGGDAGAALFEGYAAPEQYSLSGWQGSWTDVYGISAVLYERLRAPALRMATAAASAMTYVLPANSTGRFQPIFLMLFLLG